MGDETTAVCKSIQPSQETDHFRQPCRDDGTGLIELLTNKY